MSLGAMEPQWEPGLSGRVWMDLGSPWTSLVLV